MSISDSSEVKSRVISGEAPSSIEQAAILMLSMGDEAAAGVLKHFTREEIIGISQAMAGCPTSSCRPSTR